MGAYDYTGSSMYTDHFDAWGYNYLSAVSNSLFKNINPIGYRGYYYDKGISMFYLQSRYYDPVFGRFLNADDPMMLQYTKNTQDGLNLFAYCNNDPINNTDPTGLKTVTKRNYGIIVYYYQHNTAKSKILNPFGHLDIAFGGRTYSYGYYSYKNKKANLFIANTTSYQNYINKKSTFKVQDKTKLMFTQAEYDRLCRYYNSFKTEWRYSSNNFSGNYYKITSGNYKNYKTFSRNCATMVLNALEYAIPYMTRSTVSAYIKYLGTLNTPYYVNLLVNFIKTYNNI